MRLTVTEIEKGLHHDQIIVKVETRDGDQFLPINKGLLSNETIEVGEPVGKSGEYYLIELPAETSSGAWRVWVSRGIVSRALEAAE